MNLIFYLQQNGIKRMMEVIWQYKIDLVLQQIMKPFLQNKSLRDIIMIESHNDFDSNGGVFYDYLIRNNYNKKYKIVWLLKHPKNKPNKLPENVECVPLHSPSFKKNYYLFIAKYILCCNDMLEPKSKNQISVYLTHGAISIKNVKGKIFLPNGISYCLCPSKYLEPILADQYMLPYPNNIMKVLGFPVHDILYDESEGDLKKVTTHNYSKVILWMPTFRQLNDRRRTDLDLELPIGIPIVKDEKEYKELNKYLRNNNILLIIKIHPMQDLTKIKIKAMSNITILDGKSVKKFEVDNYRLMKNADAMISDYSSVANDFLHLDRPIAYTLDDIKNYNLGFIVSDPKELMAGTFINTTNELIEFIDNVNNDIDEYKKERKALLDKLFDYQDGNSCKRLALFLNL